MTLLNLVRPTGDQLTLDPSTLSSNIPILLYNVDDDGMVVDFNPQDESQVAWFTLFVGDDIELEFMWDDQDDETQTLLRDLENPV